MLNKTKIICTIGQQSENQNVLEEMLLAGMNVARLNLANGGVNVQQRYIDTIKKLSLIHDRALSIMLDTYGPKIKTGEFKNFVDPVAKGCKVTIHTQEEILGTTQEFSVNYPGLFDDVSVEDEIIVNDSVKLLVISKNEENKTIICEALKSGSVKDYCLVNVPSIETSIPCISNEDSQVLKFACGAHVDFIGASFVRNANDVKEVKEFVKNEGSDALVYAKIENKSAVDHFDEILEEADGIVISRGDLSSEVAHELLPIILKKIIRKCNLAGKPVIVGTQILSSMTRNKVPSRAEVADVANLVLDGVDGISLTNVTTIGLYPTKAVKELSKIIKATELHAKEILSINSTSLVTENVNGALDDAVANAVIATAKDVKAKLIVAFSESGATAKRISKLRPDCPIASVSSDSSIRMGLTTTWGIYPVVAAHKTYEIDFISLASEIAVYYGLKEGDTFIITGGNGIGNTNLMKVCKL
ncbi:MAG: pyruvate kinase [Bacilli bacterium]|nr:pyruvate kinase [Bacilli bacterium]